MTDDDSIHDEELDETGSETEVDDEDGDASESDEGGFSAGSGSSGSKAAAAAAAEAEALEEFSIASRQKARDELEAQIAEFLSRGGKINEVAADVTADPPKKPTSDYGGRPI